MLGRGGSALSPSRSRATVVAFLIAATLVPSLSAHASSGDDGAGEAPTETTAGTAAPPTTVDETTTTATTTTTTTATTVAETTTTTTTTTTANPAPTTTVAPTTTATTAPTPAEPSARTATEHGAPRPRRRVHASSGRCAGPLRCRRRLPRAGPHPARPRHPRPRPDRSTAPPSPPCASSSSASGSSSPASPVRRRCPSSASGRARPSTFPAVRARPVQRATRGLGARCVEQRLIQLGYDVNGPDPTFDLSARRRHRGVRAQPGLHDHRPHRRPVDAAPAGDLVRAVADGRLHRSRVLSSTAPPARRRAASSNG